MRLIDQSWRFSEIWDDLVDGDKAVAPGDVNDLMGWALFELPQNPVYRANPWLQAVFRIVLANWKAANQLEAGNREQRARAYSLRCSPYDFFVGVILAVSGDQAADEAAIYFRSLPSRDGIDEYLKNR